MGVGRVIETAFDRWLTTEPEPFDASSEPEGIDYGPDPCDFCGWQGLHAHGCADAPLVCGHPADQWCDNSERRLGWCEKCGQWKATSAVDQTPQTPTEESPMALTINILKSHYGGYLVDATALDLERGDYTPDELVEAASSLANARKAAADLAAKFDRRLKRGMAEHQNLWEIDTVENS